ncbi:hypothetical protein AB0C12_37685 [Actinoplanes sp. NPDC048967]|uniref:hypothetical protein n=1 Tax=Actinoplanes sp. NPDC048967 TaxID=3155269 RepID=UPI0033C1F42F
MNVSETIDPIIGESVLPLFTLGAPVNMMTGHAVLVYLSRTGSGRPDVRIGNPPPLRERIKRRYWRFEVDTAMHATSVSLTLPAAEETTVFTARVNLTWTISDPAQVVLSGIRDFRPVIWGFLDHLLRGISRRHRIETAGIAEQDMNDCLERKIQDIGQGVRLNLLSVNVQCDEAAGRHIAARIDSERTRELAVLRGVLERGQEEHRIQAERIRAEHTHQLEAMASRHELALKDQRVAFYRTAVAEGGYNVVMLHLLEHPNDIKTVVDMLHAGQKDEYERARQILQDLLTNNLINQADAEPMREYAISRLQSAFDIGAMPTKITAVHEKTKTVTETERKKLIKE